MLETTFFEKFDLFAETPNAVAKMRELMLELAVQGKLVQQDPNDEPARELLKQVALARSQPNKGKKGKKLEPLPPIEPDETAYELPKGWAWCRLGTLGIIGSSCRVHQKDWTTNGVPFLRAREIVKLSKTGQIDNDLFITEEHFQRLTTEGLTPEPNDLMITGVGTIGVPYVVSDTDRFYFKDASVLIFKNRFGLYPYYLHKVMQSPYWIREIHRESMGTTVHTLTIVRAKSTPIPFPPLAEQKRIVAKVDELMALCDRLEAQQQERETRHAALARASLARFADAPTPANLQFLFHPSYTIPPADLRKSILTLAVQGKLVPQDPNDEPAGDMLATIESEKKRLADKGELKADKKAWVNSSPNPPHDIPESWCWVRLQDVFEISRGGSPRPAGDPRFFGGPIPWITVGEVTKDSGKYLTQTATGLTEEGSERSRFINPGDLLLTNSGATLGVPKISKIRGCMNDGVAVLRLFHSFDLNDFGHLYLTHQTPAFRSVNQGMGQPNLNTPIIAGWFFPLPPLGEQRRIMAKVEQLMALVDALETQIAASRATAAKLMEALVAELTWRS